MGTTGTVGSGVGTTVMARTPSRSLVRLARGMGLLAGTGSLARSGAAVVSATSGTSGKVTQAGVAGAAAGVGVADVGIVDAVFGPGLAKTATALRLFATARGRLVGTPLVASLRSVGVASAA